MYLRSLIIALVPLLVVSCTTSRYSMKHDQAPVGHFDASGIPPVIPKWEPVSPQGNQSPYEVRGERYEVLDSAAGYIEQGIASWYGLKFHGELTSNGEIYNMYSLSAAHKTLPLPSYLRVTNLDNGKQIIVRVNDRGPFHPDRIIDLSYASAIQLGFQKKGTANVRLEAITPPVRESEAAGSLENTLGFFVQVAALSNRARALSLMSEVKTQGWNEDVFMSDVNNTVYRVRIGPFDTKGDAERAKVRLNNMQIGDPIVIQRSLAAKGS